MFLPFSCDPHEGGTVGSAAPGRQTVPYTVSMNFNKYMKQIGVKVSLEVIHKTALLGTAKILRKVLSL